MSIGSQAAATQILNWVAGLAATPPASLYVGLGTSVIGGALNELTTSDYARRPITLAIAAGVASNAGGITFGVTAATWSVGAIAVFDALTGGNCWFLGPLSATVTVPMGQQATFNAGALTVSLV